MKSFYIGVRKSEKGLYGVYVNDIMVSDTNEMTVGDAYAFMYRYAPPKSHNIHGLKK